MKPVLDVLHVDNHVLAVVKPAGLPCVPDESGDESLFDRAREWIRIEFAKPGKVFVGVVHRLDRPVSGVVVFARTSKGAARLAQQFRERETGKTYWGVGEGAPRGQSGLVEQWLVKDEARNLVSAAAGPSAVAKLARTAWRVLETRGDRTLFEFRPETGRPHQLRLAAASLGTPLCGDLKYGARSALPDASVALHARELALRHPTRAEALVLRAAAPRLDVWDFDMTR